GGKETRHFAHRLESPQLDFIGEQPVAHKVLEDAAVNGETKPEQKHDNGENGPVPLEDGRIRVDRRGVHGFHYGEPERRDAWCRRLVRACGREIWTKGSVCSLANGLRDPWPSPSEGSGGLEKQLK